MKTTTVVASTAKGHRIFLEGVFAATGTTTGQRYNVTFHDEFISIDFVEGGKRQLVASKGGVIDLQSKKVTTWAQGATEVAIHRHPTKIVIERGE